MLSTNRQAALRTALCHRSLLLNLTKTDHPGRTSVSGYEHGARMMGCLVRSVLASTLSKVMSE